MFLVLVVYVFLFGWLAFRRYNACVTQSGDTAVFECAFYNTLHGNLFWNFGAASCYFEAHPEPLMFLYVPLYAIAPSPEILIFIQILCIAVSSIPVFLIGCKVLRHEGAAVLAAVAFLFFPSIVSQNISQVHTAVFPLPFLLFAFYYFQEGRFWCFVILLAVASCGWESSAMTGTMFTLYALWKRRGPRWVLTSLVIPVGILAFNLGIVRSHFVRGIEYSVFRHFPGLGNSMREFVQLAITHPGLVVERLLTTRNALYLILLLTAVGGVLPFFAIEVLFVLPELCLNLLGDDGMKVIAYLYNVRVGAFLIVATLYATARMQRLLERKLSGGCYTPVITGCVAMMCLASWWQWFNPQEYQYDVVHETRQRAFKRIPADDSLVAGPGQVLAHLAHRKLLADQKMITANPNQAFNYNWVFFDMNYQRPILGEFVPRELLIAYGTNANYQLIFAENNIYILRRKEAIPPSQVTPIRYMSDEPLLRKMQGGGS